MFLRPSLGFINAQITKNMNIIPYVFRFISSDISGLLLILFFLFFLCLSMQFSGGTYWVLVGNIFEFHFLSYFASYSCQVCFKLGTFCLPKQTQQKIWCPNKSLHVTLYRRGHSFFLYSAIRAFSSLVPTKSQNERPTIPFSNLRWRALFREKQIYIRGIRKFTCLPNIFRCMLHLLHVWIWTASAVSHPWCQ